MSAKKHAVWAAKPAFNNREQELVGLKEILGERDRRIGALEGEREADHAAAEKLVAAAEKLVQEARAGVNALKAELAEAKVIIARQAGYLDRVGEDDKIREGERETQELMTHRQPHRGGPGIIEHGGGASVARAYSGDRSHSPAVRRWWEI